MNLLVDMVRGMPGIEVLEAVAPSIPSGRAYHRVVR